MKILYVTSEANPFAASGGLGDVMGALPAAVAAVEGNECEVIMPLYDIMKAQYRERLELVLDMSFNLSWRHTGASVYRLTENGVNYYDTAWGYHGGKSELVMGEILSGYPRESYYLASKFPGYDLNNMDKVQEIFDFPITFGTLFLWINISVPKLLK